MTVCLFIVSFLSFIPVGYANLDVSAIPETLAENLNISMFQAQLLTSCVFLMLFLFPTLLVTRNILAHIIVGMSVLGFCTVMEWFPVWIFLVVCVLIGLMFSSRAKDWITGK